MSGMHFLIGCKTEEFVILASDKIAYLNGFFVSKDDNKNVKLADKIYMCSIEDRADKFNQLIQTYFQLQRSRYDYELSPSATHNWLYQAIVESQRSENPWKLDVLLAGFDDKEGKTWLSLIDQNGSENQNKSNCFFRASNANFSNIDTVAMSNLYRPDMTREKALSAVKKCIQESQKNISTNLGIFKFVIIDKKGIHQEDIII
uniref:Proteasome subunit beta n=1 Tax=Panagrolaimus sp. ES5 TaxID=591445 RepID=A0AC34G4W7_9BILA